MFTGARRSAILYVHTVFWGIIMDPQEWQRGFAARLQNQWPTIPIDELLDAAGDLWRDEHWRAMLPEEAAETWLKLGVLSD